MIKQFLDIVRRYFRPYRMYIVWSIVLNFVAQWLNVFSFVVLIPILNILFKIDQNVYTHREWTWSSLNKDLIVNNAYAWVQQLIASHGAFLTLCLMGAILIVMTALKCIGYWGAANIMMPLSTGVVRDIRMDMYNKIMHLPLSFFSAERKGDIIVRMSTDIQVVENSVTSAISTLIQQPIAIIICFVTLFTVSWQLTAFVLIVTPPAAWLMGTVSKRLKSQSASVQAGLAEIMSQIEETLSGLRIVKAFIAEEKMARRFNHINNEFRKGMISMMMRINAAHPVSETMGTVIIVIVLLFGGWLILDGNGFIDASTFIFYMVILYSVINPIKDLTRQAYMIPLGLTSMERIDYILKAENPIKETADPKPLDNFENEVEMQDVSFHYVEDRDVLRHINLTIPKGKTVALVGQSGSGKSTLVDLIPRYHDVSQGRITIDGKDLRDVRIHDLRALIGNVNQEAILFNDTFYNNITFGVENATMEQVIEAAKDSQRTRLHHGDRARLQHRHRRPRQPPLRRTKAARQHRPRHPQEPAHPHPRRSHLRPRHRKRAPRAGSPRPPHEVAHHHRHRPPPPHHPPRRHHTRPPRGSDRRKRPARRTHRPQWLLQTPLRHATALNRRKKWNRKHSNTP